MVLCSTGSLRQTTTKETEQDRSHHSTNTHTSTSPRPGGYGAHSTRVTSSRGCVGRCAQTCAWHARHQAASSPPNPRQPQQRPTRTTRESPPLSRNGLHLLLSAITDCLASIMPRHSGDTSASVFNRPHDIAVLGAASRDVI